MIMVPVSGNFPEFFIIDDILYFGSSSVTAYYTIEIFSDDNLKFNLIKENSRYSVDLADIEINKVKNPN